MKGNLTNLERDVMRFFLAGNHPALEKLRYQLELAGVGRRQQTAVGFFTTFCVPPAVPRKLGVEIILSDVGAIIQGLPHGAGFFLFIKDGVIQMLEGATFESSWPQTITSYQLNYIPGPSRDIEALERELAPLK